MRVPESIPVPMFMCCCRCLSTKTFVFVHGCVCACESAVCVCVCIMCALKTWIHIYVYLYMFVSLYRRRRPLTRKKIKEMLDTDFSIICFSFFIEIISLLVDRRTQQQKYLSWNSILPLLVVVFFRVPFAERKHIINISVCFSCLLHLPAHPAIPSNMHTHTL